MQALTYQAYIEQHPDGFLVRFLDVPGALTQGDTLDEAIAAAPDALAAALEGYLELGRDIPASNAPAAAAPGYTIVEVAVPPALAARLMLARAMAERGLSAAGLARKMERDEKVVRRILAGKESRIERTLDALAVLNIRPALAV